MKIQTALVVALFFVTIPTDFVSGLAALAGIAANIANLKVILTPPAAFAGLITGIIGTVLGALSVKLHLEGKEDDSFGGFRKRSVENIEKRISTSLSEIDNLVNEAYVKEHSRCLEKLVCNTALKQTISNQTSLSSMEEKLLKMTRTNSNQGLAFQKMEAAMKAGFGQANCDVIYDACALTDGLMFEYMAGVWEQSNVE